MTEAILALGPILPHSATVASTSASTQGTAVDIDAWYRRYGEAVFRRARRLTGNDAAAWDLTQEVFLRAHQYRNSYRGEAKPSSWLFTICDRRFLDRRQREEPVGPEELDRLIEGEQRDERPHLIEHDLVRRLLSRAPNDVCQIVIHHYFDELDHQQIASRLGVNERTVRRKLQRFLERAQKVARK